MAHGLSSGAKVLVVDSGGRGNAIAHAFARSEHVAMVYVAPGNAGSLMIPKCSIATARGASLKEIDELRDFVISNDIDLTFVGPEGYLSSGIVDRFMERGLQAVGPTKDAAILEGSKAWTKDLLNEIKVPIPEHRNFSDPTSAKDYVREFYSFAPQENLVVKADGLAAGKGSIVCSSAQEALLAIERIMQNPRLFGSAGDKVVIERRLNGRELMFFAVTDGSTILPLESAMDYKQAFSPDEAVAIRLFNRLSGNPSIDNNPNTGGMGGFSPHPWLNEELTEKIMSRIARPTIKGLRDRGIKYRGFIYFGLMIVEVDGLREPYVLEINVRLGDPEAQVILPRLNTDMFELSTAILEERLSEIKLSWSPLHHVGICAISGRVVKSLSSGATEERPGYPGAHYTNMPIRGLEKVDKDVLVYHNGTAFAGDAESSVSPTRSDAARSAPRLFTTGGRVFTLVASGETLDFAMQKAYDNIKRIRFNGIRYRKDIAKGYS
jgi:phosphoribosylamine--glycine ligase